MLNLVVHIVTTGL